MTDATANMDKPQQSYTRATIEYFLGVYTEAKEGFFTYAHKDDVESEMMVPQYYNQLLGVLHTLLELSKADNRNVIGNIIALQEQIEAYDRLTNVDDDVIDKLRHMCAYVDSELLFPYLTTLKPQLSI